MIVKDEVVGLKALGQAAARYFVEMIDP